VKKFNLWRLPNICGSCYTSLSGVASWAFAEIVKILLAFLQVDNSGGFHSAVHKFIVLTNL
jgi:hypothetical protein